MENISINDSFFCVQSEMSSLHKFIVHYPPSDDPNYIQEMGTKLEFRELLLLKDPSGENEDDPFFYNYQALVSRWWAPWTNNRIGLLRWDPGSGKTRGALAFALTWMRHSHHKKVIFISNSDIVLRSIEDEVVKYNNFDIELERGVYKQGRRAHGKTIRKSRYVKKQGFERYNISSFMNKVRSRYQEEADKGVYTNIMDYIRDAFHDYVVIVDEVHGLRGVTKDKQQYNDIITFLDSVRESCPILLMTATPIVNTWKDIFSILGMLHGPDVRKEMQDQIRGIRTYTNDPREIELIDQLVFKYSKGLVSDRRSTGVVPTKVALPGPYNFDAGSQIKFSIVNYPDTDEEERIDLEENIFPLFMSSYQTEYTSRIEGKEGLKDKEISDQAYSILGKLTAASAAVDDTIVTKNVSVNLAMNNSLYLNLRIAYDFAPPFEITDEGTAVSIKVNELVYMDMNTRHYYPSNSATIKTVDGIDENVFLISWVRPTDEQLETWNKALQGYYTSKNIKNGHLFTSDNVLFPDLDTGLGKYSIKYAMLVWMLRYHPVLQDLPGYIHTLWVETGTKLIAAALNTNGWEQYVGNEPIDQPTYTTDGDLIPRFAIIDGNTKPTHITRIIETFNSAKNREGKILRVVLGSRKSGISISLTNGRFFIELSPDFNKATRIQSEGRVFRADSLLWMKQLGMPREVFTADILTLPSIPIETEEDIEIHNEYIGSIRNGFLINQSFLQIASTDGDQVRVFDINPVTIEARMYQLSEIKYSMGKRASKALRRGSIENIVKFHRNRPVNTITHALLYGASYRKEIKDSILDTITHQWIYPLDREDMYVMKTASDMISHHTMANTRYGMPRPVQSFSGIITASRDAQIGGITGTPSSQGQLSLIYERNFFLVGEQKGYPVNAIRSTISLLMKSPLDRYDFYRFLADMNLSDSKVIALELALVMPIKLLKPDELSEFNKRRDLILSLFEHFWDAFGGGRVVHILWYAIKNNSYLSKLGINNVPSLKTRILTYDISTNASYSGSTENRWRYIENTEREAIYLSRMAMEILRREEAIIKRSMSYGYYLHLSLYDGELRLREINIEDKRKSKTFVVDINNIPTVIASILGISTDQLSQKYLGKEYQLKRDIFFRGEQLKIIIIR